MMRAHLLQYARRLLCLAGGITVAFREEYTTYDSIMEGLLVRAGFTIERALYPGMMARYWCRKASLAREHGEAQHG